ncbi:MAG: transcription elongation factor GreA [Desulfobulbaceae bacterium A2]|nr:MAG: transcription elongation factor GreA [Desulfobulbaceae bacterium A2]
MERVPMSRTGYQRLRAELERLERVERYEVVRSIERAREHGDLKENAEYHAAKERQGMIEGRIMELKDRTGRAEVIDCLRVSCKQVVFGTVVTLLDLTTEEEVRYQLLGSDEVDVNNGAISVVSPLGRAILGKRIGDEVRITKPRGGVREFEVIAIDPSTFQ